MGGKSSTISTSEQRILSLQVQQSSQGLTLPVVYGRARVAGNLVWYGDFTTYEHKTTTRQGGKGGGGVKQEGVKYTYEAAVMVALAAFAKSSVARLLNERRYQDACNVFALWNKADGRVVQGLANRRADEQKEFFRNG